MKIQQSYHKLYGLHTVNSIMQEFNVSKQKAIYYVHRLRKKGYVRTRRTSEGKRIYDISLKNKIKGINYYDIINKYAPIGIAGVEPYFVYGKTPSLEETLIFAIKTKSHRTIQAALYLFKRIENWPELYHLAKKEGSLRQIGALYCLARKIMKVRKISNRFITNALPKKEDNFKFILEGLKSKDFKNIETIWKVYIPFNKEDFEMMK